MKRNRIVANCTRGAYAAAMPATAPVVHRTLHLDVDPDAVREALTDPGLLSAWLGRWTADPEDPSAAWVITDDGVARRVRHLRADERSVRWEWAAEPADPDAAVPHSEVVITFAPTSDGGTDLQLTERARGEIVALDGFGWAVATLALEVALAVRAAALV